MTQSRRGEEKVGVFVFSATGGGLLLQPVLLLTVLNEHIKRRIVYSDIGKLIYRLSDYLRTLITVSSAAALSIPSPG